MPVGHWATSEIAYPREKELAITAIKKVTAVV
jgi:hypothetical protein